jgi:hypothetical protein
VNEDDSVTTNGVANDNAGPDNEDQTLTVVSVTQGANGSVVNNGDGTVTYTPDADFFGTDSYTYTIEDSDGAQATATVNITITSVNDDPVAVNDDDSVNEDDSVTTNVVANDNAGPDNEDQTLTVVSVTQGANGSVVNNGDGTVTYTPDADFFGTDSYTYTIEDSDGAQATATVSITITSVNDAPEGSDNTVTTLEDVAYTFKVADFGFSDPNDDPDNGFLAVTITNLSVPTGSKLQNDGVDVSEGDSVLVTDISAGKLVFTPAGNANGAGYASFDFQVQDDGGIDNGGVDLDPTARTMTIDVTAVNDAPEVSGTPNSQEVQYSDSIDPISIVAMDPDSTVTITTKFSKDGGTFVDGLPEGLEFDPDTGTISGKALIAPGTYVVRVTASDGELSDSTDITIKVNKEDARSTYTGDMMAFTTSSTGTTAEVILSATIKDISAVTGSTDAEAGDIRNASVTFLIHNATTNALIATISNVSINLISSGDTTVATAFAKWTAPIGTYTVSVIVNKFYTAPADSASLTVSAPTGNFVTGGGYMISDSSAGSYASTEGLKTNFGFNVTYNKKSTSLQGNVNIIFRRLEADGTIHTYQIKSNSLTGLGIQGNSAKQGMLTGKATLTDITDPLNPISISGGLTLQLKMTDYGTGKQTDTFCITLWDKSGKLMYVSNWNGTTSVEQPLSGGNIVVH